MTQEELFANRCKYACDILTFEEYRSMGLDAFHKWVEEHIKTIPKSELVVGETYPGECRNARRAVWKENGKFEYMRTKFGSTYPEEINHYEDDNGYDVFVPMKEV